MSITFPHLEHHPAVPDELRLRSVRVPRRLRIGTNVDGVFEGGGALGAAYVGALRALADNNIWFARVAGNSAGAITAAMIAAGFTAPEIQFLSSAFPGAGPAPRSLRRRDIREPIPFVDFLDLPATRDIEPAAKRKTHLWKALNGQVLDEIGRIELPIPTQADTLDGCVAAILAAPVIGPLLGGLAGPLRDVLNVALSPLPNSPLRVRDFLPDTTRLRREFADAIWDVVADAFPAMAVLTNIVHEGSVFEGATFTDVIGRLLALKVHDDADATVRFEDLAIPLAVIASNIDTGEMHVYSSATHERMSVIAAVRRSMSIPFVFQPQGPRRQVVDGGLCSNFPLFLFADGAEENWPQASRDVDRVVIGFALDERVAPPPDWGAAPGRFRPAEATGQVDPNVVMRTVLADQLVAQGHDEAAVVKDLIDLFGDPDGPPGRRPDVEIVQQLIGVITRGVLNTEESTRQLISRALMADRAYVDVTVPLLGYDVFDFGVNSDEPPLLGMWDRAWRATMAPLLAARDSGLLPAGTTLPRSTSPFR